MLVAAAIGGVLATAVLGALIFPHLRSPDAAEDYLFYVTITGFVASALLVRVLKGRRATRRQALVVGTVTAPLALTGTYFVTLVLYWPT